MYPYGHHKQMWFISYTFCTPDHQLSCLGGVTVERRQSLVSLAAGREQRPGCPKQLEGSADACEI